MFLKSALVALMISFCAGSALAAHASNKAYDLGYNAPNDMPRPTKLPDDPRKVWRCYTDKDGAWKKNTFGIVSCDFVYRDIPTSAPVQSQSAVAREPVAGCPYDALYCDLPAGIVPTDKATGKQDAKFLNETCSQDSDSKLWTCTWRNLRVHNPEPAAPTCGYGFTPDANTGICYRNDYFARTGRYPYQYNTYGYGYNNVSRGYNYHPSSWDAPSACSSFGEYHRNGGRYAGRC